MPSGIYIRKPLTDEHRSNIRKAVHAINYIWEDMGEKSKDECYAYAIQAVVHAIEVYKKQ